MGTVNDLNLAVIGNCSFSALVSRDARIVWSCMPHFDGDPVFCNLLGTDADEGAWSFALVDFDRAEQKYTDSTAILETRLYDRQGGAVLVTDFLPRRMHYGRAVKPLCICRTIEPVSGAPRVTVRLRPRFGYGASPAPVTRGSNHLRFVTPDIALRLTTDAPLTHISGETPFLIDRKYSFVFGQDEPVDDNIGRAVEEQHENTRLYWREFTRALALPPEWQDALIRAAITLKMCSFEDTGAIIAAMTTSVPESPDSQRNWDYRYCWLRDALFVVNALNRLNTTRTMEDYLGYIMNLAVMGGDRELQPLYGIALQDRIEEYHAPGLPGYRGMGPVRVGNAAYVQRQNDVWGAAIMALTQAFFDKRLMRPGTIDDFRRLEAFGERAAASFDTPDAGIWEFRTIGRVHTFSAVMCWVACDRLAKIAGALGLDDRAAYWRAKADAMHEEIMRQAWNPEKNSFVEPFGGEHLDASLLLLHEVGFIDARDQKFVATVAAIERELLHEGLLYRYVHEDDFSKPDVAFTVCTFWYIDALAACGRVEEARRHFEWLLTLRNHVGLLSEDMDFKTHELWGNFPQTYSMVGLINSAMRLSKTWAEVL